MATLCIPFTFVASVLLNYWPFGRAMCPIVQFVQTVAVFLSTHTLVAISIDRYMAIIYPLRPKTTKKTALLAIVMIWTLSILIPLPTALKARATKYVNHTSAPEYCIEKWEKKDIHLLFGITILTLQYFLPLLILIFTYGSIIVVMWVKKTPGEAESTRDHRMKESKKKIIKMMVTVVVIYAICWLPLHIINIAGDLNPGMYDLPHMNIVWALFHWLAMSNSMYNPIIYCWMNSKFRMGFKRVFSRMLCGLVKVRDESDNTRNFSRQETVVTSVHSTSVRRICFSGSRVKFTQEDIPLQPAKTKA